MRILLIFLSLIASSAWAEPCDLKASSFEEVTESFLRDWSGDPNACQAQKFKQLNKWLGEDMRANPDQYDRRMIFVTNLLEGEARDYLILSFQETWFYLFINQVLEKEFWRTISMAWDPRTLTAMAATVGLLLTPPAKSFRTKSIRYVQKGLRFFLERRASAFVGVSIVGVTPGSIVARDKEHKVIRFVKPPLFFLDSEDQHYDSRTDNIYIQNLRNDFIEISGGVLGSTLAGTSAVRIASQFPRTSTWGSLWSGLSMMKGKAFKFLNPRFLIGVGATFITTKILGEYLGTRHYEYDFNRLRQTILDSLERLRLAIESENELAMWLESQKIKNTLILDRNWLVGGVTPDLWDLAVIRGRRIVGDMGLCILPREGVMKEHRPQFYSDVAKLIADYEREIKSSQSLFAEVSRFLKSYPNANLPEFREFVNAGLKEHEWDLNSELSAEVLWQGINEDVSMQNVPCVPQQTWIP